MNVAGRHKVIIAFLNKDSLITKGFEFDLPEDCSKFSRIIQIFEPKLPNVTLFVYPNPTNDKIIVQLVS